MRARRGAGAAANGKGATSKQDVSDAEYPSGNRLPQVVACVAVLAVGTYVLIDLMKSNVGGGLGTENQQFYSDAGLLRHFSKDHNESLYWGTYRPGVIFGAKTRTFPEALVAGLMWTAVGSNNRLDTKRLRHTCEESETRQGLAFGYSEHDGHSYGKQPVLDPENKVSFTTFFLKRGHRSWTTRIAGNSSKGKNAFFFYLAVEEDRPALKHSPATISVDTSELIDGLHTFRGKSNFGDFRLSAQPQHGIVKGGKGTNIVPWFAPPGIRPVDLKDKLISDLTTSKDGKPRKPTLLEANRPAQASTVSTSALVLQVVVEGNFEVDFTFDENESDLGKTARPDFAPTEDVSFDARLAEESQKFQLRFESKFGLRQAGFSDEKVAFAQSATSAMLGGLGYFFGSSKVKVDDDRNNVDTPARPLFTAVPSRSFFPRGFLWDEGFHQMLVGRWNPSLCRDVISHWFDLMHSNGWIPREQIRGAEALSKVPDWAVPQHPSHANPPTFLLALEALVEQSLVSTGTRSLDTDTAQWLSDVLPSVERWFLWFVESQGGKEPMNFRWHGRDPNDGKLNAMTLSSGLDDFPRASAVSDEERHVDLHSWVTFGAGVLSRLHEVAGSDDNRKAEDYRRMQIQLLESLDRLHWNDKQKRYSDFGYHSNDGKYAKHVVVKCAKPDGSDPVEHAIPTSQYNLMQQGKMKKTPCPSNFPKFLFPLGDGQGGLLTREKFVPKTQKLQFVNHTGYVNLFPLLLRLLKPDSEQLHHLMDLLGDPQHGIWSDFGLRSLSAGDKMYLRDNAPGDAPYWRGPIWINCNFLAVQALRYYATSPGPNQKRAAEMQKRLSDNVIRTVFENFQRTGFLWEQYNDKTGTGQRTHPFNGWSSLVVLMMAK